MKVIEWLFEYVALLSVSVKLVNHTIEPVTDNSPK